MKIYSKILFVVLPLLALSVIITGYIGYNSAQTAIFDNTRTVLDLKLTNATDIVAQNHGVLVRFGLDTIASNIKKAQTETFDSLKSIGIGETGYIFVVDSRGIVQYHPNSALIGTNVSEFDWFRQLAGSTEHQEIRVSWPAGIRLAAATYFEPWNWHIVSSQDEAEILGPIALASTFVSVVVVAIALVGSLVLAFAIRRITGPLNKLAAAAARVGRGDWDITLDSSSGDELGQLAAAFSGMAGQLKSMVNTLEDRVVARTRRLETVAAISEQLNKVLDHEQLLKVTVEQLQEKFGYYHVHIYLLDEAQQKLVVVAGTGSAGTHMVANRHSINLKAPTSLVAQSARSGSIVWLDNVQESPIWLPNPLLPNTRAEMAVPIIIDGQVAGVLDVQENRVRGFDEGDASLLRSLASQAAVAIRNARLFGQVEKALAEARLAQERYMQEAWAGAGTGALTGNHQFQQPDVLPPDKAITDQLHRLARRFKQAVVLGPDQPTPAEIENEPPLAVQGSVMVAPIKVQNQTVGAIQLHHPEGDHRWAELDLALVQVVSDQVAQVAENLRLFEDTRQRARREHTIRQITEKMRSATSLHHLVEITAHELATHFSAGHTLIELGMEPEPANGEAQEQ